MTNKVLVEVPSISVMMSKIIETEGGYVNDPYDSGGPTNYGVTLHTFSAYVGHEASIEELQQMTKEQAADIFLSEYYLVPNINLLPQSIQYIVTDMSVNHGRMTGVEILQVALNSFLPIDNLKQISIDGIIGPITVRSSIAVINKFTSKALINKICDFREALYQELVVEHPTNKRFIVGWTNRNNSFRVETV